MTNDHIGKNIIQMMPNFTSLESVKNIVCVGQIKNKIEQKTVPMCILKIAKNNEA